LLDVFKGFGCSLVGGCAVGSLALSGEKELSPVALETQLTDGKRGGKEDRFNDPISRLPDHSI
jgi:hypothetical protein